MKAKSNNETWGPLYLMWAAILILLVVSGYFIYGSFCTWEQRGQFGDMFGSVNTLFSGFAFAGIIYTISLQREELKEQRKDNKETRKELSRQAEVAAIVGEMNALSAQLQFHSDKCTRKHGTPLSGLEEKRAEGVAEQLNSVRTRLDLLIKQMKKEDQ